MKPVARLVGNVAKAIAAGVLPLVSVSLTTGSFDWKAILDAGVTAIAVFLVPNLNRTPAP